VAGSEQQLQRLAQQIAEGGQVCVVDQDRQRWLLKWQV